MSIYHYTNIKSLALILNSGKIRFTRLDLLDDLKEIDGLPDELKTLFYVSCWTEGDEESLALWSMYTGMKGIRIEFPKVFYTSHHITKGDYGYWGFSSDIISPLPIDKIRTDEYFIGNSFWLPNGFYVNVEYVDNCNEIKSKAIVDHNGEIRIDNINNLLRFKDSIWKFQNESRFYLMAIPLPPLERFNGNRLEQMKNYHGIEFINQNKFIDVDIDTSVLNNIKVRMHPNCDQSDKIIVESLLYKYTNNGSIQSSNLDTIYRNKH